MAIPEDVQAIRYRLQRSWVPFFTRFGRLTAVQVLAIPKILNGSNVVVVSPTASGKTEAVLAPVAELLATQRRQGLAALYIVPTRALANDTLARVEGPLGDMGIAVVLKHGDKPYLSDQPPDVLITTPESLDSLICRRPQLFAGLRVVILDEVHLVDNTYRGDQLRLLLWRLRHLASNPTPSVHLLSATLAGPVQLGKRYVGNFEVVSVPGQRSIDYHFLGSFDEVYGLARTRRWNKLLCFCNRRESVENMASQLGRLWRPYPVLAHHGKLSRQQREEAETVMREAEVAVCVATSTLEVGIDIGDIDLIVLAEVPWSISSLLQRIGRGNRREDVVHVGAIAISEGERIYLKAMFETAATGALPERSYDPDLSVAVQQTFSYLFQHPEGATEGDLLALLSPLCSGDEARLIVGHLQHLSWLEWRTGRWFASTKLMNLGEKGRIHSNIPDAQDYEVVDIDSGIKIGRVAGGFDRTFVLGQRTWRVVSMGGNTVRVRGFSGTASAAVFQRTRNAGAFFHLLPPSLMGLARNDWG